MHPCPNCSSMTAPGSRFCARCGFAFGGPEPFASPSPLPRTSAGAVFGNTQPMPSFLGTGVPPPVFASEHGVDGPPVARQGTPIVRSLGLFAAGAVVAGFIAVVYVRVSARGEERGTAPPISGRTQPPVSPPPSVPEQRTAPAPAVTPPMIPAPTIPAPQPVNFGMPIVHYPHPPQGAVAATGQPDGRFASVRDGFITLQMPPGEHLVSDGSPAADLQIVVDPSRPGPFHVEIGVGHNVFVRVAAFARGSVAINIDTEDVRSRIGRFVRVSTRGLGSEVAVDAVLVRAPGSADGSRPDPS